MALGRRFPFLLTLPLAVALAGCLPQQKERLAACEADAAQALPHPAPGQLFKSVQTCMEKSGYRFIGWNDGVVCDMGALIRGKPSLTRGDAVCFEPTGWLALKYYRIFEVPEKSQTSNTDS